MVIFILTNKGYEEMESIIKESNSPVWINDGVLSEEEINKLRSQGIELTKFSYFINKANQKEILGALETIKEHHPGEAIWTEL